jgi:hypothetical protein
LSKDLDFNEFHTASNMIMGAKKSQYYSDRKVQF